MGKEYDFLESERKKLWERVINLEEVVKKRTPELEADARQNSRKCSEFRNKCEQSKEEAFSLLEEIKKTHSQTSSVALQLNELKGQAHQTAQSSNEANKQTHAIKAAVEARQAALEEQIATLEALFEDHDTFVDQIESLESSYKETQDYSAKIKASYTQMQNRATEVDELYYKIIGYQEVDEETGEEKRIPGLKDQLEIAYSELKSGFEKFQLEKKKEIVDAIEGWKLEYQTHSNKIQSLLPNALTAGLSYAYTTKKQDEIEESQQLQARFQYSIFGLIAVSLIPFAVSIHFLLKKMALNDVILQMPRLVLAILPLYIPVLWMAYSANKKLNLSKRLIEEYTHKEVLSKTFEGLAKQIEDLKDSEISEDLRTRLLFNILEVSSENPGKLISDYDKSDHPLMDALDKSVKLTNAIDKLANIPGLKKLTNYLEVKANRLLAEEQSKAEKGIKIIHERD